jgi:hypothetical protein
MTSGLQIRTPLRKTMSILSRFIGVYQRDSRGVRRRRGAGPPAGQPPTSFGTKAWAVQRNADGTDMVRITQFAFDGAGLQQALEAEGVPALVVYRVVNDPSFQVGDPATLRACAGRSPAACWRVRSG